MSRSYCALLALLPLLVANSSHAAVFERDWKVPGDGLLTYDDVNKREWLDLTVSRVDQFEGENPLERFQSALLEFAPGGLFEGFTFAKRADVVAFGQSAGVDTMTLDFAANQAATNELVNLTDITFSLVPAFDSYWSTGLIDESTPPPASIPLSAIFEVRSPTRSFAGRSGLRIGIQDGFEYNNVGLFVFRPVPEPTTPVLALAALMAIATRSRILR